MAHRAKMTWISGLLATFVAAMLIASPAVAGFIDIDNSGGASGGQITYDGVLGHAAMGTDIAFDKIKGEGTPLHNGDQLTIVGGMLDFTTGGSTVEGPDDWFFGGGGTFTLMGQIDPVGDFPGTGGVITLLEGTWTEARAIAATSSRPNFFIGAGTDFKADVLVEYFYGVFDEDPLFMFSNTEIIGGGTIDTDTGAFTINVDEADITNRIPIPGSSLLMLLGLSGLALWRRRN